MGARIVLCWGGIVDERDLYVEKIVGFYGFVGANV